MIIITESLKKRVARQALYIYFIEQHGAKGELYFWEEFSNLPEIMGYPIACFYVEAFYVESRTCEEMARRYNTDVEAIASRLRNAISKLTHVAVYRALHRIATENDDKVVIVARSVESLELPTMAKNLLKRHGCKNVGDVINSLWGMDEWRCCGEKTKRQIIEQLKAHCPELMEEWENTEKRIKNVRVR